MGDILNYVGRNLGKVRRVIFNNKSDVSIIDVSTYGHKINSPLTSFSTGAPSAGTTVKAYTGISGVVTGTVLYQSADVQSDHFNGEMLDMLVVRVRTQPGDSGACLTSSSVFGESAVGILSFGTTSGVAVFTKITNIR